ncbi:MAG: AraC family transcriptional regulator [Anaerocolumna sp.]
MKKTLKKKNITFIKYFLSYFIVLTVSFIGFFYAVKFELKNVYFKTLNTQNAIELDHLYDIIKTRFLEINQINILIQKNTNVILSRYSNDNYANYLAANELQNHISGNFLLDNIIYLDKEKGTYISSKELIRYNNNTFYLYFANEFVEIPLAEWHSDSQNKIVYWKNNSSSLFFYIPAVSSHNYSLIYVINEFEFKKLLEGAISSSITSICLTDNNSNMIAGVKTGELTSYLPFIDQAESGYYELDKNTILYVMPPFLGNYKIAALSNRQMILVSVQNAFKNTYLILIGIGILGLLLIILSMQLTYLPLHRLAKKIAYNVDSQGGCLKQISDAFDTTILKNQELQDKINNYRMIMQKSILDSIILEDSNSAADDMDQIDHFFNLDSNNSIFAVKIMLAHQISAKEIKEFISQALPADSSCIILDYSGDYSVFLINYSSSETHKEEVISLLFHDFYEETGCKAAISNSSPSPMDIPALFENALLACSFWNRQPVVSYNDVAASIPQETTFYYPYKKLESLAKDLENLDFTNVNSSIRDLLKIIDLETNPDFFIRCILIDMLTLVINLMNKSGIRFEKFSEVYFETLYFCRSCKYSEKNNEIASNIYQIIAIFEAEIANTSIHISQVKQFIQENYLSSEFSITLLADHFHASIAYMSYLFKKKTNENLSDYVWQFRLERAKDLLKNTDMPIDEISIAVGYVNSSSFRRKFKQTMNVTPTQYRLEQ